MTKPSELQFGDIVKNHWASNRNPQKILMVRKVVPNHYVHCIDRDGSSVKFSIDRDLKLEKVGGHTFDFWDRVIEETKNKKEL